MRLLPLSMVLALGLGGTAARAGEPLEIVIRDHRFTPAELHVPAGQAVFLKITNQDTTAEEFEMTLPAVEKVVTPGSSAPLRLRPLGAGRYPFIGEFHAETAQGVIIAE